MWVSAVLVTSVGGCICNDGCDIGGYNYGVLFWQIWLISGVGNILVIIVMVTDWSWYWQL